MKAQQFLVVTAVVFSLVAALHLLRIVLGWTVVVAGWHVPLWVSWLAIAVLAVLVGYAVKFARQLR